MPEKGVIKKRERPARTLRDWIGIGGISTNSWFLIDIKVDQ